MPSAKGASAADEPPPKRAKPTDGVLMYEPSVVRDLSDSMNSLVEVLLPPKHLVSDHKQVRARRTRGGGVRCPPVAAPRSRALARALPVAEARTH